MRENERSRAKKKEYTKSISNQWHEKKEEKAERESQKQIVKHGEEYCGKAEKFGGGKKTC